MNKNLPFTLETLLEQCGGNREIGKIILDEFLEQIVADTREIASSLASGDLSQAGRVGHRLKGSAGVLGAEALQTLCLELETAGKAGNAEEAAKIFADLNAEADRCTAAVPTAKAML